MITTQLKKSILIAFSIVLLPAVSSADISSGPSLRLSLKSDDFAGNGKLTGYVTNNVNNLPDVARVSGRYRANLTDNRRNKTLHFNQYQGRLDAKLLSFPFEFIARNIGIGTQNDSQLAPSSGGYSYIFAGVQVHVVDLNSRNSSHIVVGHRGKTSLTVEGKNTVNGSSVVDDLGIKAAPLGRVDIRVVGESDRTLRIYWQQPNLQQPDSQQPTSQQPDSQQPRQSADNWILYDGSKSKSGRLPGKPPSYGAEVYIGLITYAQGNKDLPFVGTSDGIEIFQK